MNSQNNIKILAGQSQHQTQDIINNRALTRYRHSAPS